MSAQVRKHALPSLPPVCLAPAEAVAGRRILVVGAPEIATAVARIARWYGGEADAASASKDVVLGSDIDRVVLVGPRFRRDWTLLIDQCTGVDVRVLPVPVGDPWGWYSFITGIDGDPDWRDGRVVVGREWWLRLQCQRGLARYDDQRVRFLRGACEPLAGMNVDQIAPDLKRVWQGLADPTSVRTYQTTLLGKIPQRWTMFFDRIMGARQQYFEFGAIPPKAVILNCGIETGHEIPFFGLLAPQSRCVSIDPLGDGYLTDYVRAFCDDSGYGHHIETVAVNDRTGPMAFAVGGEPELPQVISRRNVPDTLPRREFPGERIDDLVGRLGLDRVDVIKMDIEGGEPDALVGARETISRHRPLLMISVYHAREHYYEIPLYLMELLREAHYKFAYGHYSWVRYESVFYGIPQARN